MPKSINKYLRNIKRLPRQTKESLEDALGIIVQLEATAALIEWNRKPIGRMEADHGETPVHQGFH